MASLEVSTIRFAPSDERALAAAVEAEFAVRAQAVHDEYWAAEKDRPLSRVEEMAFPAVCPQCVTLRKWPVNERYWSTRFNIKAGCLACGHESHLTDYIDLGRWIARGRFTEAEEMGEVGDRYVGPPEAFGARLAAYHEANDEETEGRAWNDMRQALLDLAELRARSVLLRCLKKHQRRSLVRRGWFDVVLADGRRFRLYGNKHNNLCLLDKRRKRVKAWCVSLGEDMPVFDSLLGELMRLRADGDAFLALANELPDSYQCWPYSDWREFMRRLHALRADKAVWKDAATGDAAWFAEVARESLPARRGLSREAVRADLLAQAAPCG